MAITLTSNQTGTITAAGYGCPADKGFGHGVQSNSTCASSGGAYAGVGDFSYDLATLDQSVSCMQETILVQQQYGDPRNPLYEVKLILYLLLCNIYMH